MSKDTTMKIDDKINKALAIIVGELQTETGEHRIAAKDALWAFIRKHRRDIADRAERLTAEEQASEDATE